MTIVHKGIRRKTTDVLDDYGQSHYLQNVRLKRIGEMGRRAGLGKSTMAQLAGPVQFMIGAWSNEPFIVNGTGGTVTGNSDPLPLWTGATMRIPDGQVGQPAAPVIVSVTATPATGAYVVGAVTMTAVITYDGLSGPLIYNYDNYTVTPGGSPIIVDDSVNPATYIFDGSCIPGLYQNLGIGLTVSTTLNGFFTTHGIPDFTVT